MIAFFNLGTNLGFVEGIATLGKFFFAVTGLSDCLSGYSKAERMTSLLYRVARGG